MICFCKKCMETPMINIYPYRMTLKINGDHQYNTLVHCQVQLAIHLISRSAPMDSRVIDLFDIQSSQDSCNNHDLPPPHHHHCHHKRSKKSKMACYIANCVPCRSISEETEPGGEEDNYDDDNNKYGSL